MTLDQARQKAREWLELVGRGIDPKVEETRRRAAAQRRELNSFAAVAAEFLERPCQRAQEERRGEADHRG